MLDTPYRDPLADGEGADTAGAGFRFSEFFAGHLDCHQIAQVNGFGEAFTKGQILDGNAVPHVGFHWILGYALTLCIKRCQGQLSFARPLQGGELEPGSRSQPGGADQARFVPWGHPDWRPCHTRYGPF